jgi:hypothetical protein
VRKIYPAWKGSREYLDQIEAAVSAVKREFELAAAPTESRAVDPGVIVERVLAVGDLGKLTQEERASYYLQTCGALGLNPLTQPFGYIRLNGELRLYAQKNCTDQLRRIYRVSIDSLDRQITDDQAIATAIASLPDGRRDSDVGSVAVRGLHGDALSNAIMKAITKAKRRVTLSIVGLGMLDDSEIETIRGASRVEATTEGEIVEQPPPRQEGHEVVDDFIRRLEEATERAQVMAVAHEIADASLSDASRAVLRPIAEAVLSRVTNQHGGGARP